MRNDQLAVMLRDFGRRCLQWADVLDEKIVHNLEYEDTGLGFITANRIHDGPAEPPSTATVAPTPSTHPWRRGDYFFCEGCGQRKQWFRNTAPWQGAICASCYNAELARIEAARGRKA